MSELKVHTIYTPMDDVAHDEKGKILEGQEVYLKSEADKVIAELESKIEAGERQIENLINSATDIMLRQDRVNDTKCEELRHQKFKRCMAMVKWCEERYNYLTSLENYQMTDKEYQQVIGDYWDRWYKRWLELAEKFKEAK